MKKKEVSKIRKREFETGEEKREHIKTNAPLYLNEVTVALTAHRTARRHGIKIHFHYNLHASYAA